MKKYLVIGNPIEHSLSPLLHNYWIKENNIDGVYEKKQANIDDLPNIILQIKKKQIQGGTLTILEISKHRPIGGIFLDMKTLWDR